MSTRTIVLGVIGLITMALGVLLYSQSMTAQNFLVFKIIGTRTTRGTIGGCNAILKLTPVCSTTTQLFNIDKSIESVEYQMLSLFYYTSIVNVVNIPKNIFKTSVKINRITHIIGSVAIILLLLGLVIYLLQIFCVKQLAILSSLLFTTAWLLETGAASYLTSALYYHYNDSDYKYGASMYMMWAGIFVQLIGVSLMAFA